MPVISCKLSKLVLRWCRLTGYEPERAVELGVESIGADQVRRLSSFPAEKKVELELAGDTVDRLGRLAEAAGVDVCKAANAAAVYACVATSDVAELIGELVKGVSAMNCQWTRLYDHVERALACEEFLDRLRRDMRVKEAVGLLCRLAGVPPAAAEIALLKLIERGVLDASGGKLIPRGVEEWE